MEYNNLLSAYSKRLDFSEVGNDMLEMLTCQLGAGKLVPLRDSHSRGASGYAVGRWETKGSSYFIKGFLVNNAKKKDFKTFEREYATINLGITDIQKPVYLLQGSWWMICMEWINGKKCEIQLYPTLAIKTLADFHSGRSKKVIISESIELTCEVPEEFLKALESITVAPRDYLDLVLKEVENKPELILCHLGGWPDNVIVDNGRPVLVDWASARGAFLELDYALPLALAILANIKPAGDKSFEIAELSSKLLLGSIIYWSGYIFNITGNTEFTDFDVNILNEWFRWLGVDTETIIFKQKGENGK